MSNDFRETPLAVRSTEPELTPVFIYDPNAKALIDGSKAAVALFFVNATCAVAEFPVSSEYTELDGRFTPVQFWKDVDRAHDIATIPMLVNSDKWMSIPNRTDYGDLLADYDIAGVEEDHYIAAKSYGW